MDFLNTQFLVINFLWPVSDDTIISSGGGGAGGNPVTGIRGKRGDFMDINDALGLPPVDNIDIKDDFIIEVISSA